MVKLYYTPTSCGAASFIAALAAQVPLSTEQVDIREHKTSSGADFYQINPKGNVPALVLDDGTVLNENVAVLQYIADLVNHSFPISLSFNRVLTNTQQNPGKVAGVNGTLERAVLQNILAYLASEVHPSIGGLFNPTIGEEVKHYLKANASKKLAYLDLHLLRGGKNFLLGDSFTIADSSCILFSLGHHM